MTAEWLTVARLRYRKFVAKHGSRAVIVLLAVGLLGAGVAVTAATSPPTETITQPTDTVVVTTTQTTAATVTGETDMYDRGTVVRDSPIYLTTAAPNVSVTARVSTEDDRQLTVDQRLVLVYKAVDDGETFWERKELVAQSSETVEDGNATITATLDVTEVLAEQRSLDSETGGRASVRAVLSHSASYETGEYDGEFDSGARIAVSDQTYSISDGISAENSHLERERTTRLLESKMYDVSLFGATGSIPKRAVRAGLVAVVCLLVGGHAAVLNVSRTDIDEIERELTRHRFSSWISQAEVPDELDTRRVSASSLVDLVDVAIDANSRVVYDPTRELYAVLTETVTYTYSPELPTPDTHGDGSNDEPRTEESDASLEADDGAGSDGDATSDTEGRDDAADEFDWGAVE